MKLSEACKILKDAFVPNAKHDAMEIFAQVGKTPKTDMLISDVETEDQKVVSAIMRRAAREPMQYILGRTYFYNEEYEVNENVLIPRSDTEILVDYACKHIPKGARFADLCTGSGCVGISTLKNTRETTAILADISESALEVAKRNAEKNGVSERCELLICDVMRESLEGNFYAVLSNPPYVMDSVYETLESEIFKEPKIAFVGGEDGADFYRRITKVYRNKIADDGFIAYEIGYDQADILRKIAEENRMTCEIIKDFSGNDRLAVLKKHIFD